MLAEADFITQVAQRKRSNLDQGTESMAARV